MTRLGLCAAAAAWSILFAGCSPARPGLEPRAREALSQIEGRIHLDGLAKPVEVLRDTWGVPHIFAQSAADLFFAQGFVAAQDRLFQMEIWRRAGAGELAEILGPSYVERDRFARLLRFRGDMEQEWSSYSPDARELTTAFVRGVNAYIEKQGDRLPIEFQLLGVKPGMWKPEDCLLRLAGLLMCRNAVSEITRARLISKVGPELAAALEPPDPPVKVAALTDPLMEGIDENVTRALREAIGPVRFDSEQGSNNWVVDGTLSATGKPILANDPHRPVILPSLRYMAHLVAPGWNVIGSGEPALPGIAVGHNERIAFGFTIVGIDQQDIYVERTNPSNPNLYRWRGDWRSMEVRHEKIAVKGRNEPVDVVLKFTVHGPVIYEEPGKSRAFALRWVGSEPGTAGYLASLAADRAQNWQEFTRAMERWKVPSENMVYADVDGNIGWVAAALTPVRKGWDGLLPVPGAKGVYEWQGFLPREELPQSQNPSSHYVATANQNILPAGYHAEISYEWSPPYRFARIKECLEAKKRFTLEDFQSIQHDITTLPGRTLARLIKIVDMQDRELQPYVELLAGWDGVLSADSRAGVLYGIWLQELLDGFYHSEVPARLLDFLATPNGVPVLLAALEKPNAAWFGEKPREGRDRLLRTTFRKAVNRARKLLPGDEKEWSWGRLHTTTFRHPLASLGPAYAKAFNLGPVPRGGDAFTPNAASHNLKFEHTGGATYRHILDLADWDRGLATSAPGQSGQLGSPHYDDLLPLWQKGEYFPLAFSRARVEKVARHRLILIPAER